MRAQLAVGNTIPREVGIDSSFKKAKQESGGGSSNQLSPVVSTSVLV